MLCACLWQRFSHRSSSSSSSSSCPSSSSGCLKVLACADRYVHPLRHVIRKCMVLFVSTAHGARCFAWAALVVRLLGWACDLLGWFPHALLCFITLSCVSSLCALKLVVQVKDFAKHVVQGFHDIFIVESRYSHNGKSIKPIKLFKHPVHNVWYTLLQRHTRTLLRPSVLQTILTHCTHARSCLCSRSI